MIWCYLYSCYVLLSLGILSWFYLQQCVFKLQKYIFVLYFSHLIVLVILCWRESVIFWAIYWFSKIFWFKMISFLSSKDIFNNKAFSQNCFLTRHKFGHFVFLFCFFFLFLFLFCCCCCCCFLCQTSKDFAVKMVEE